MEQYLTEVGVAGVLALLILDKVFAFVKKRNGGDQGRLIKDLWDWHNVHDTEGVKLWYVRKSLEDAIKQLADNIGVQTSVLRKMHEELKDLHREQK